jgi:hypothetical protein
MKNENNTPPNEKITNAILYGEIKELLTNVKNIKEDVTEIKTQTTLTNGRVTRLEHWQTQVKNSVWWILGIGGVLGVIIGFVIEYISNQPPK